MTHQINICLTNSFVQSILQDCDDDHDIDDCMFLIQNIDTSQYKLLYEDDLVGFEDVQEGKVLIFFYIENTMSLSKSEEEKLFNYFDLKLSMKWQAMLQTCIDNYNELCETYSTDS